MSKRIGITVFFLVVCGSALAYGGKVLTDKLERKYFSMLDGWVQRGGQLQAYHNDVLETCEKLVLASATISEVLMLPTIQTGEFDFRVNVCAKTTVHRVHRQPELNDPRLVQEICDNNKITIFGSLCRRSNLR